MGMNEAQIKLYGVMGEDTEIKEGFCVAPSRNSEQLL